MLQFIIGTAGTGKTSRLLEKIMDTARAGGRAILLVPEQLSFESEKRLHRALGPQLSLQVEVLSFTRLCNSVFRELGGLANLPVTPAAKYLLMSLAVGELRDSLNVYRKSADNASFLQTLVDTCGEFKTAGIPPQRLAELAAGWSGGPLGDKLGELSALYGAYQALLTQGFSDGEDDLIRACTLLELHPFFAPFDVFVDGFTTFMAAEFELLGHVIAGAQHTTFAMTCDSLDDRQRGMGVFSPVKQACGRLLRLAEASATPVAEAEICTVQRRFAAPELGHVAQQFLQPAPVPYEGEASAVRVVVTADHYQEIEMVAGSIAALVAEKGLRYNQIAVAARDTGPYLRALETVFPRYGIPYFADQPQEVENHPLVAGLLRAVDAVRSNFDTEAVLLLAKSPLLGLPAEEVAELENYCYCWGVRGAVWSEPFGNNPRGLAESLSQEDGIRLDTINRVRTAVVAPLETVKSALNQETGLSFATGLFALLEQVGAAEHLTTWADSLEQDEQITFLQQSAQIWDVVVGILDIFGTVLGRNRVKKAQLCDLLRLALGTAEIGLPPQTLDQVLVGMADRIRPVDIQAVFVIGANEGVFPAQVGPAGVFSDAERQEMIQAGLEISAPTLQKSVLEQYFAYFAVTLASQTLAVSYPRSDLKGQELLPSVMVSQLQGLFPALAVEKPDSLLRLAGEGPAFQLLAEQCGSGSVLEATLRQHFGDTRQMLLNRMDRVRVRPPHQIHSREVARSLFGGQIRLSPTRVERFFRCPFSYFAADGLALKKRQKVEFTPLESGSVIHNVLQVMVQRHGGKGLADLTDQQLKDEIRGVIQEYLSTRIEELDKLPERFKYLFGRLTGMLARLLHHLGREFQQSQFVPAAFELPISRQEGVEPLRLQTADGVTAVVEGVVDRVDILEKNGSRYVRVVDYKSGSKTFSLHDILYGLNMQMLLYLFSIQENGEGELADTIPAGVLYMPVRESFISADRDTPEQKLKSEREKQWRMSGLLLEDEEVLRGMEQDMAGVFIPAKLGKDGELDAKSSLAGKAEMGRLSRKVKELVTQMVSALGDGQVTATPVQSDDYKTCQYCDYRTVCGYQPGDAVREIAKIDRAEVLKLLGEEEDHG